MDQGAAAPEMEVESLPLETRCPPFPLRQYNGFWIPELTLRRGVPAFHSRFTPRPSDIILASFPKSGTTWLKALAFTTLNRATHPPSSEDHPLCRTNPHDIVRFVEIDFAFAQSADLEALPSPRLLATHLPHSLLPERLRETCRIACVGREPKDALVSWWKFIKKAAPAFGGDAAALTFQEAFDLFCDGRCPYGPPWRYAVEYWEASVRRPDKVLFLRYEEMLREPRGELKRLAEFMGCDFSVEEEERGVADAVVELCSLDKLKNMEVNRTGRGKGKLPVENADFFRKGVAGDWSNHMSPEMAQRLDKIVEDALQGSGFSFINPA
ncbi:hypothetical protein PR202_ga15582 [Eleusine coracana subsp. coracana]|uniref:Sulfotransferase n=1 Tax=Eleusine coracana subsp. coracana TaxID=191504 RepID=A0AAV5CJC8_ELECO|nr:hypothetical protein QOZ80_6BG0491380 [Eleusine coracana subsp. coracana]GJM98558.1 hypothetical protein PR202_ga15582 [Eleusine coracana subsp. coracana]